jgi:hypothetical protein
MEASMRIIECTQGSEEWLAARAGIATASCFGAILARIKSGEAAERRNYRARLVVERLTGRSVPAFVNAAMKQGTEREPLAREAYEVRTGAFVREVGLLRHDTIEAGASPDGLIDNDGGLEIKCPELATHLEYLRLASEPPAYTPQIQGCMWISGRDYWDFVSFNPDFPPSMQLVVRRVRRDEKYIAGLALAVELFMSEVREEEMAVRNIAEAA